LVETDEDTVSDGEIVDYSASLMDLAGNTGRNVRVHRFPVQDRSVPDIDVMKNILDIIDTEIAEGKLVYVHCLGGLGRTGTVVGCWLARHGIAVGEAALAHIAELRRDEEYSQIASPQTWEQCEYVKNWLPGQ
jgi:protein-tyrosine phosphatase